MLFLLAYNDMLYLIMREVGGFIYRIKSATINVITYTIRMA